MLALLLEMSDVFDAIFDSTYLTPQIVTKLAPLRTGLETYQRVNSISFTTAALYETSVLPFACTLTAFSAAQKIDHTRDSDRSKKLSSARPTSACLVEEFGLTCQRVFTSSFEPTGQKEKCDFSYHSSLGAQPPPTDHQPCGTTLHPPVAIRRAFGLRHRSNRG